MNPHESDDILRQRVRELGSEEEASAPMFSRVIRGRRRASPAPARARSMVRRAGLAWALAVIAVLIGGIGWHAIRRSTGQISVASETPVPPPTGALFASEEDWNMPTDGLLADAEESAMAPEVERLAREVTELLRQ